MPQAQPSVKPKSNVLEYPHYPQEKQHLQDTLAEIETQLRTQPLGNGTDRWGAMSVAREKAEANKRLLFRFEQSYIGRVDWHSDGLADTEIFYISELIYFPNLNVFPWQEGTMAASLYYTGQREGEQGKLLLKHSFEISHSTLKQIYDEYVSPDFAQELATPEFTDVLLRKIVGEIWLL